MKTTPVSSANAAFNDEIPGARPMGALAAQPPLLGRYDAVNVR